MIHRSTIQLLRFPFSYFLMPVFWFSLSFIPSISWERTILVFVLLHVLLYPSSNGYNSYMDRDETAIGGILKPMQPTEQLFYVTVVMDAAAALASFFVSPWFAAAFIVYIVCSRLYSYRGVRLKRFAVMGYLTVLLNQGALTFFLVYHGCSKHLLLHMPWEGLAAASFLIGGFYPITQVYQHESDAADGVRTISMMLGKRGTFIFCGGMYAIAFGILFYYFMQHHQVRYFLLIQFFFIPVILYFARWLVRVWKNGSAADFKHTMQMNWIASTCTNLAFITLLIIQHIG